MLNKEDLSEIFSLLFWKIADTNKSFLMDEDQLSGSDQSDSSLGSKESSDSGHFLIHDEP